MRSLILALAAGICLVLLSGCSDSDRPGGCGPSISGGMIQGRVNRGAVAADVQVVAQSRSYSNQTEISTQTDSTGNYRLAVPPGDYFLIARISRTNSRNPSYYYRREGPPYPDDRRDTVRVSTNSAIKADFSLGSAVVRLHFPAELESKVVSVEFVPYSCSNLVSFCGHGCISEERVSNRVAVFRFPAVEPGPYQIRIFSRAVGELDQSLWLLGTRDRSEAYVFPMYGGGTQSINQDYPAAFALLRGSVTGSWQHLNTFAPRISLFSEDSTVIMTGIPVQRDGSFEARIFLPRPVKALVQFEDSQRWFGGRGFAEASVLDLQPGMETPLVMAESGILLQLWDPTYQPSWRARARLVDAQSFALVRQMTIFADFNSPAAGMSNVEPGTYLLQILPDPFLEPNWLAQWYGGGTDSTQATVLTVPSGGQVVKTSFLLREGGRIGGRVWYLRPPDSFGAIVYLTSADDPAWLGSIVPGLDCSCMSEWTTPADYMLRGLPAGRYKVGVCPWKSGISTHPATPPEQTVWYPGNTSWAEASPLTITGAERITGIDFNLRSPQ
jgi:hypothetical protein